MVFCIPRRGTRLRKMGLREKGGHRLVAFHIYVLWKGRNGISREGGGDTEEEKETAQSCPIWEKKGERMFELLPAKQFKGGEVG